MGVAVEQPYGTCERADMVYAEGLCNLQKLYIVCLPSLCLSGETGVFDRMPIETYRLTDPLAFRARAVRPLKAK